MKSTNIRNKTKEIKLGRCYEHAGEYMIYNYDGEFLVHGSTQSFSFERRLHAWVVLRNGNIWEPASKKVWDRQVFDNVFHPLIISKYAEREMFEKMCQFKHYGPWDCSTDTN